MCEYAHSKIFNDEYYTKREEVSEIFEKVIGYDFLKDKIIYCPCDTDESEFVKYLKENKNIIQYKELIYTSDDFNTHIDLIEYADLVITNPPFSKIRQQYFPLMLKHAKYFFFFHSVAKTYIYNGYDNLYIYRASRYNFITPFLCNENKNEAYVNHIYLTNFKCNILNNHVYPKKTYNEIYNNKTPVYAHTNDGDYLNIDRLSDIPIDYDKPILVPLTVLYSYYRQYYDILPFKCKILSYSDNRNRFVRILVNKKSNSK